MKGRKYIFYSGLVLLVVFCIVLLSLFSVKVEKVESSLSPRYLELLNKDYLTEEEYKEFTVLRKSL